MSKRALIIGVNRPQNDPTFAPLRSAERDANDLASALHDCGFQVQSLIGPQATTAAIRDAIAELREQVDDKSDLFIAFCGHGAWIPVDGHPDGATFLVSADYLTQRAKKNPKHYLSLDWWYEELLDWNEPRSVVLVLDCCFAGNVARAAARHAIDTAIVQRFRGVTIPTGRLRAYLAATISDEKAYEDDRGGLLTQTVVACLRDADGYGDGLLTVSALIDMVKKQGDRHPDRFHPFAEYRGDYHWVLADHREARRAAREAQQAEQRRAEAHRRLKRWRSPRSAARRDELLRGFVGREAELRELSKEIERLRATGGYLLVTGVAGQGKSSILAKLIAHREPEPTPAYFIHFTPGHSEQAALLGHLVAELLTLAEREADALTYLPDGDSVVALCNSFEALLSNLAADHPLTLVIDGLDQIEPDLAGRRDLSFLPEQLPPGVVLVIGTRPDDTLKPLKLRTPYREYCLPPLSEADFAALLRDRGVTLSAHEQSELYHALNGNAFDLAFLAQEIRRTPHTEIAALLQRVIANPRDLFTPTLERLQRDWNLWERVLHPLLGTLLAAQEPLSRDALRDIIGVTQDRMLTAIERLGGLLGVRDAQGQPRYSLIHLKLIDYLHTHMFATDDLIDVHAKIAAWCSRDLAHLWQPGSTPAEQERRIYGQTHLVTHLAAAQKYDDVWRLLDADEYGAAKRRADPSLRAYIADLDRVRQTIADASDRDRQQMATWLARAWRYSLLRVSLTGKVDAWPTELFTALVAMGRGAEARDRAELLSDLKKRAEVLTAVGRALLERGAAGGLEAFRRARAAAEAISDPYKRAEALRDLAQALAEAGQWADARAVAETIADPRERAWALREVAGALAQAGDTQAAQETFAAARAVAETIADPRERAGALREVAGALAQAGRWDDARAVAETIADPRERAWALREVAGALVRAGRWDDARAVAETIADPRERAGALREVAGALAQAGRWDDARAVAETIAVPRERAWALREVAGALAQAGDTQAAQATFAAARAVAETIADPFWRAEALREVAGALAQAGDTQAAQATFAAARAVAETIADPRERAGALREVAGALAQAGDTQAAQATFAAARAVAETIAVPRERAWALREVAGALAQAGDTQAAQETFAAARAVAETIADPDKRAEALREVAGALAQAGRWDDARAVAETIADPRERAEALREVAGALAQAGRWDDARAVAETIADPRERAGALREVAGALAQAGDTQAAQATFAAARAVAETIADPRERAWALREVAGALAQAGRWDDARAVAETIADPRERAWALREVAGALVRAGRWDDARAVAETIADPFWRAEALREVAGALAQAGDTQAAQATFAAARAVAETIAVPRERAWALQAVAGALAQAGDTQAAQATFAAARAVAARRLPTLESAPGRCGRWQARWRQAGEYPGGAGAPLLPPGPSRRDDCRPLLARRSAAGGGRRAGAGGDAGTTPAPSPRRLPTLESAPGRCGRWQARWRRRVIPRREARRRPRRRRDDCRPLPSAPKRCGRWQARWRRRVIPRRRRRPLPPPAPSPRRLPSLESAPKRCGRWQARWCGRDAGRARAVVEAIADPFWRAEALGRWQARWRRRVIPRRRRRPLPPPAPSPRRLPTLTSAPKRWGRWQARWRRRDAGTTPAPSPRRLPTPSGAPGRCGRWQARWRRRVIPRRRRRPLPPPAPSPRRLPTPGRARLGAAGGGRRAGAGGTRAGDLC
jgi:tetratricopeptide (TPR) repeat protein